MNSWFIFTFLLIINISHILCGEDDESDSAKRDSPETEATTEESEETTTEETTTKASLFEFMKPKPKPKSRSRKHDSDSNDGLMSPSVHERFKEFQGVVKQKVKEGTKKIAHHLDQLLMKLDVRNMTQFVPFYDLYRTIFKKKYKNDTEADKRMGFFKKTILAIKKHNVNLKVKYQQGLSELSDLSWKEVLKNKLGFRREVDKPLKSSAPIPPVNDLPAEWDWRQYGILTEPRNQGTCGSCWSFAAAAVLESHNMKRLIAEGRFDPKQQLKISEQNLIDCSSDFGTIGCDGGMPQQAFRYVSKNGVNDVDSYPYKGKKDICGYDEDKKLDVMVKEPKRLRTGMDKDLATAIYNYGPIAIAIHVTPDLTHYKSGLFDDPKCDAKQVNHAVVAVGYAKDYFIVRNSWGPRWGEGGYFRVSRSKVNNCGISQQGYYPILPNAVQTQDMRDKLKKYKKYRYIR